MDRWYLQINPWARGTLWVFTCLSGTSAMLTPSIPADPQLQCLSISLWADLLLAIYIFSIHFAVREEVAGRAPTVYFQRLFLWPLASTLNSDFFFAPVHF
jgi:hypothetical protein